jgi:replicative DNA helicase
MNFNSLNNLYDLNAEKALLSLILIDPNSIQDVAEEINFDMFYHADHKIVFQCMKKIHLDNSLIDSILLLEKLRKEQFKLTETAEDIVKKILSTRCSLSNKDQYVKILKDKYNKRILIDIADNLYDNINKKNYSYLSVLNLLESKLINIYKNSKNHYYKINDIINNYKDNENKKKGFNKIGTGFTKLDELTGGWHNNELTIIASRPSIGKTSFSINLMLNLLRKQYTVLFFSIEMSSQQILLKFLSHISNISYNKIRSHNLDNKEKEDLEISIDTLNNLNLYICDNANININEIESYSKEFLRRNNLKLDFIFIDYLQLIRMNNFSSSDSVMHSIGNICRILRHISRNLNIPIVVLSQLNRMADVSNTNSFSHLKSSGSIEESADNIFFLLRYYEDKNAFNQTNNSSGLSSFNVRSKVDMFNYIQNKEKTNNNEFKNIRLSILKQRNGPLGFINFNFYSSVAKFVEK